jgi:hypothetical protein
LGSLNMALACGISWYLCGSLGQPRQIALVANERSHHEQHL